MQFAFQKFKQNFQIKLKSGGNAQCLQIDSIWSKTMKRILTTLQSPPNLHPSLIWLNLEGHIRKPRYKTLLQCLSLRNWFIRLIFFPAEIVLLPREQNFPSKRFQGSCSSPADMHHRIIFRATFTRNTKWTILKAIQ